VPICTPSPGCTSCGDRAPPAASRSTARARGSGCGRSPSSPPPQPTPWATSTTAPRSSYPAGCGTRSWTRRSATPTRCATCSARCPNPDWCLAGCPPSSTTPATTPPSCSHPSEGADSGCARCLTTELDLGGHPAGADPLSASGNRPVRTAQARTSRPSQTSPPFKRRTGAGKSGWRFFHTLIVFASMWSSCAISAGPTRWAASPRRSTGSSAGTTSRLGRQEGPRPRGRHGHAAPRWYESRRRPLTLGECRHPVRASRL
jgi:hypothetical protein